jgi:hypothetical protein
VVQFGGQGHPALDPGSRVAASGADQRGGGGGWPERRAVRGGRTVSERASPDIEDRQVSAVAGQTGRHPQERRGNPWLGIPTVKSLPQAKAGDRIVQTALKMAIEPIPRVRPLAGPRTCFEAEFHAGSYGFRPGRGCKSLPSRKRGTRCGKSRDC